MAPDADHAAPRVPAAAGCAVCKESDIVIPEQTVAHLANRAAAERPGVDLALVLEGAELAEDWLERMRRWAADESTTATVTPLPGPTEADHELAEDALPNRPATIDGGAAAPRIALAQGGCVYLARGAFDLLGGLDESMPSSAGAVAEFGLRARARGLANLLAGDLLVTPAAASQLTDGDRAELERRLPLLWRAAIDHQPSALARARLMAATSLRRLTVTLDARTLGPGTGGTQTYTRQLIGLLSESDAVELRALIGPDAEARSQLHTSGVERILTYEEALRTPRPTDVVHRPQQAFTVDDLCLVRSLGRRLVITHLDLIAHHNPAYFADHDGWRRHVRATREAFRVADHVIFFSDHARRDAAREDLGEPDRTSVIGYGIDLDAEAQAPAQPPAGLDLEGPFLLCIGADYAHKNRPFALQLTAQLRADGWPGLLVLAGPHVPYGSTAELERQLAAELGIEGAIRDLGVVSDAERRWLQREARAVVYPTVIEGLGLVPFEAAAAGTPCLFAAQTSLAELLPAELATLDGWEPAAAAAGVAELLADGVARRTHVDSLRAACRAHDPGEAARRTVEAYRRAVSAPPQPAGPQGWEALEREAEIVRLDRAVEDEQAAHRALRDSIGADGLALVGPEGLLSTDERRILLAASVRPGLRRALFGVGGAFYRALRGRDGDG